MSTLVYGCHVCMNGLKLSQLCPDDMQVIQKDLFIAATLLPSQDVCGTQKHMFAPESTQNACDLAIFSKAKIDGAVSKIRRITLASSVMHYFSVSNIPSLSSALDY